MALSSFTFKIKPENVEKFAGLQPKKSTIKMEGEKMETKQVEKPSEILVRVRHLGLVSQKAGPVELQILPKFSAVFDECGETSVPLKMAGQLLSEKYPGMYEEVVSEGGQRLVPLSEKQKAAIVEKRLLDESRKPIVLPEEGNVRIRNKEVARANIENPVILKILPTYSAAFDVDGVARVPVEVARALLEGSSIYELVKEEPTAQDGPRPGPIPEPVLEEDMRKLGPVVVRSKKMPKPEVTAEPSAETKADFVKQIVE